MTEAQVIYFGKEPAWSECLSREGYAFSFRQDTIQCIAPAQGHLAILDLDHSGVELFRNIDDLQLPLLALSGAANREAAYAAAKANVLDYLLKPFAPSELLKAVTEALNRPQRLQRVSQDLRSLAENGEHKTAKSKGNFSRVTTTRLEAWHHFFLMLRAQVLTKNVALSLWDSLMALEKIFLRGLCTPVEDDPTAYLLLIQDILNAPRLLERTSRAGRDQMPPERFYRFLDRVEQREIDEPLFLIAAALWLSGSALAGDFQEAYQACWA